MTNAVALDRHQAHIFYLSKIPELFWQIQMSHWMNLATENEMLKEKADYEISWERPEESVSYLITKQYLLKISVQLLF
jgi:hypothetical protein